MGRWMRRAAVFAALFLLPLPGVAQDVTLTSRDGQLEISGQFQGYDGELFRVMTEYGLLTIDGAGVICDGPACPDLTGFVAEVRVVGEADAGARLLPALIAAFAAERGYAIWAEPAAQGMRYTLRDVAEDRSIAVFSFAALNAQGAADALRQGDADLALAALTEPDLGSHAVGTQALVAMVAPGNPLAGLATADLARVLSGQVDNWRDIGGPDMPLVVHALLPEAGFRRALEARLGQAIVSGQDHGTLAELDAAVARDPWGLAVTAASAVTGARVLPLTDSCGFVLQPSRLAVKAEDYPLSQPFFLLTPKRRLPLIAREFLEFLRGPAADGAIAEGGLIDRGLERTALLTDGIRLANAIRAAGSEVPVTELQRLTAAMTGAERLSLTFRFDGGARTLDAASRDNLADLVRLIEIGTFEGQELIFAGFSDGSGAAAANLDLSRQRADLLREAVAEAVPDLGDLRVSLGTEAFGEVLPMACDESPIGRQLNRRVELWLRPVTGSPAPEN